MNGGQSGWEAKLPILNAEQREHILRWLDHEEQTWAEREEQWQQAREAMVQEIQAASSGQSTYTARD